MEILNTVVAEYAEAANVEQGKANNCKDETCRECLHAQYYPGRTISYDCDEKLGLYVAGYFPVHCKEVRCGLELIPAPTRAKLVSHSPLKVACMGGGPGTDVVAAMQWLNELSDTGHVENPLEVHFLRMELNKKWNGIADDICGRYKGAGNLKFRHWYSNCDVTTMPKIQGEGPDTSLFVMSYLVSELSDAKVKKLAELIQQMANRDRCVLIVNDRPEKAVSDRVEALLAQLPGGPNQTDNSRRNCGVQYSDAHKAKVSPKLMTKSVRWMRVLYDH